MYGMYGSMVNRQDGDKICGRESYSYVTASLRLRSDAGLTTTDYYTDYTDYTQYTTLYTD